ncbi:DUF2309 domain-containing protein [Streptomyces sp. NPDC001380]|uniref:DUF2309 domain-containing protein n=1 Tax=Streptomyces sp. NPDC001380 TaxID=3364566 RepID=UPI00369AA46C
MTTTHPAPVTAALIEQAARPIPALWPVTTAIAVNPLWDLRGHTMAEAVGIAAPLLGITGLPDARLVADAYERGRITDADLRTALSSLHGPAVPGDAAHTPALAPPVPTVDGRAEAVTDREVAKWCAAYVTGMLGRTAPASGFYATWREWAGGDPLARRLGIGTGRPLPAAAEDALALALEGMGADDEETVVAVLSAQLARLPGWAAHAKWRTQWAAPDHPGPALHLGDYLAVRLTYDAAQRTPALPAPGGAGPAPHGDAADAGRGRDRLPEPADAEVAARLSALDPRTRHWVWLAAYEGHYRDGLLAALDRPARPVPARPPAAQLVCCIDVRSEGLRRHVEAVGDYETFGFAGFFGLPARVRPFASDDALDLFPVLLRPAFTVGEASRRAGAGAAAAAAHADLAAAAAAAGAAQKAPLGAYLLAEAGGFALGPLAVARTLAPRAWAAVQRWARTALTGTAPVTPVLSGPAAPSDTEQADFAEAALAAMGLTERFAPLVLLCGHGSTTTNNPYASALDCGACGAARGGTSARLAAAVLNRAPVRALLAERGLPVPDDTVFVAAEHDTATDTVTCYDVDALPATHQARMRRLRRDLATAGQRLAAERARDLPAAPAGLRPRAAAAHTAARAADWSQVRPEWGLARNAAFLVAPRAFSAGLDLGRRCFLHSYRPETDPDGAVLEAILSGPAVVAHWINAQYYFSTVDPDTLGAGDKIAHNVVGDIGVHQGAGGDLRLGLPRQSVFTDHSRPYHEPMRLLVAVTAPRDRLDTLLHRSPTLADLVDGAWIHLAVHDADRWWLRRPGHGWTPWRPAGRP